MTLNSDSEYQGSYHRHTLTVNIDSSKKFLPEGRTDSYLVRHMDAHDVTGLRNAGLVDLTSTQHLDNDTEKRHEIKSEHCVYVCGFIQYSLHCKRFEICTTLQKV